VIRGDMVIARTPLSVRALAAGRHYIPANVPLVKRVAGVPGDRVCAAGVTITVNGRPLAARRASDRLGRPLPWWTGCRTLRDGALLLVMADTPDSFDGRYFGPTSPSDVIGKATLLWRR
jgi:type IV secretory pathway protease TraF